MRPLLLPFLTLLAGCAAATDQASPPPPDVGASPSAGAVEDDGTYLSRVDPLGGQWRVESLGGRPFAFPSHVHFSAGGFLNHGAGCHGGHPAFYRLDGADLQITRLEEVRIGKCETPAAGESERILAGFLDRASRWSRQGDRLLLSASDGRQAVLVRPPEPHPQLAGRWLIESIGGRPFITERRPGTVTIRGGNISMHADCNSIGGSFTVPAPGRIALGDLIGTQMGCPEEDHLEDEQMAVAVKGATSFRLEGERRLILDGGPGMVLRRPPAPNRRLQGEYEHCGNTLLGAYHEGPVTLAIDGASMRDNAGCTATYRAEGPELALELADTPACADPSPPFVPGQPVSIGGEISTLAVAQPDAFGFTDEGQLVLRTQRGLLALCRKGDPRPFGS